MNQASGSFIPSEYLAGFLAQRISSFLLLSSHFDGWSGGGTGCIEAGRIASGGHIKESGVLGQ